MKTGAGRPPWLKVAAGPLLDNHRQVSETLKARGLSTVCRESACPNIRECWNRREVTFLILGDVCTRTCRYCRVGAGAPAAPDPDEARRVAQATAELGLKHVVITSVTRDDLPDGGAVHFRSAAEAVRRAAPGCGIELLVPDFGGEQSAAATVAESAADVVGHNIETVPRLFPRVRPAADYRRSIKLLGALSDSADRTGPYRKMSVKSGFMVGLGEEAVEIHRLLEDLREARVDSVTIGQYLSPSPDHFPVVRYWRPEEFVELAVYARSIGFNRVLSGPLVRSSYRGEVHSFRALRGE